jgi:hypothetical protein
VYHDGGGRLSRALRRLIAPPRVLMEHEPTNRRMLLWAVAGGLAAWGALLALGAFLGLDPETPDYDVRRMLIVGGSVAAFLAVWLGAIWWRGRR